MDKLLLLTIVLLSTFKTIAQTDSTMVSDSSTVDTTVVEKVSPIKLEINANGIYNQGNVKRGIFNSTMRLEYKTDKTELLLYPQYTYATQNEELRENEPRLYSSFEVLKHKPFYGFGFSDISKSYKRKILYQHDIGLGVGKYLMKKDSSKIAITVAYVHQKTDFETKTDIKAHRVSFRFKGVHTFKKSKLTYIFWYKPAIDIKGFYIIDSMLEYSIPITKFISFSSKLIYRYDNLVAEDVVPEDIQMLFGVKVKI
jgi:hypothetical protein